MSKAQIAEAVAKMAELKAHPREDAVNRFLLRRAERLYQELAINERTYLDRLMSGFEEALEMRQPEAIERHRGALHDFMEQYDPGATQDNQWNNGDD